VKKGLTPEIRPSNGQSAGRGFWNAIRKRLTGGADNGKPWTHEPGTSISSIEKRGDIRKRGSLIDRDVHPTPRPAPRSGSGLIFKPTRKGEGEERRTLWGGGRGVTRHDERSGEQGHLKEKGWKGKANSLFKRGGEKKKKGKHKGSKKKREQR